MLSAIGALGLLAACVPQVSRPVVTPPPPVAQAANAALLGVTSGPSVLALRAEENDAAAALDAYQTSCHVVTSRDDVSGLTRLEDWRASCAAAPSWPRASASLFFDRYFAPVQIGEGVAFATGYFEPEILGSRTRRPGYDVPVYGLPDDLVREWPAATPAAEREGRAPLARRYSSGEVGPYFDRTQIEQGALAGRDLEIAWAADPVELFFLQIQGSGRLRTPEGDIMRIGYAGQNGHAYTGIGGVMRERGLLGDGPGQYAGSMQGIMQYLRENPQDGADLMRLNRSWVFFRELTGTGPNDGPIGSIGVPVTAGNSVAVDPKFVPYGAPVWLDLDRNEADGLWVAQDTGGAIRGANRFDTFWGAGSRAREIAGGMSGRGQALVLLPKESVARLRR